MWTEITRPQYRRKGPGYSSSMTDGEWALIAQFMPSRRRLGRPPRRRHRRVGGAPQGRAHLLLDGDGQRRVERPDDPGHSREDSNRTCAR